MVWVWGFGRLGGGGGFRDWTRGGPLGPMDNWTYISQARDRQEEHKV
jgi:hypothetical protein